MKPPGGALEYAADFTDEEARRAPEGHLPLVWYFAHLMCTHDHFLKLYVSPEGGLDDEFVMRYAGPCSTSTDFSDAPPLDELREKYKAIHERTCAFLAELTAEDLDRKAELIGSLGDKEP